MAEFNEQPLLAPGIPFRGINTATPASHLPPGKMADATNLRVVNGALTVRPPCVTLTPAADGQFRGAYECLFDGAPTLFVATALTSGGVTSIRIYKSVNLGAFSEITAASGPYGNTRLTDRGLVEFQIVRDRTPFSSVTPYDCLIIQNGTDAPMVYAHGDELGGGFAGYGVSKVVQPDTPANVTYSSGFKHYVAINNSAKYAYAKTDAAKFNVTNRSATVGLNSILFTVTDSWTSGQTIEVDLVDALACPSLSFAWVVSSAVTAGTVDPLDWSKMKVDVYDGAWHTVYDPADATNAAIATAVAPTGNLDSFYQYGAHCTDTATSIPPGTLGAVTKLRFTWMGSAATAGRTFNGDLYLFAAQGYNAAGFDYAVSFMGADLRSEGPSTVALAGSGSYSSTYGGSTTYPVKLSTSPFFAYDGFIRSNNSTLFASGMNRMLVYRRSLGESNWFLMGTTLMATWGGAAWAVVSSLGCFFEDTSGAVEDLSRPALDSGYVVVPVGRPMTSTSSRLFVGAGNRLWYSQNERPFQFRQFILDDGNGGLEPDSAGSLGIDGESTQALFSTGSLTVGSESPGVPSNGISTVFVLTDRTVSWLSGWDATSLNKRNRLYDRGTYSPKSIAAYRTGFFFLDSDRQVIKIEGFAVGHVSRDIVDTTLAGIPSSYIGGVWGAVRNNRFYLAYTGTGLTSNRNLLVYDVHESERIGEHVWLKDLLPGAVVDASALFAYRDGNATRLIGVDGGALVSGAATMFEHESSSGTSDSGYSGVPWSMTFPEVHNGLWEKVRVRRCGIVGSAALGDVATTRTSVGNETPATSTGTVRGSSVLGTRVVRWDADASGNNPGLASSSVSLQLSGTSPSGDTVLLVVLEVGTQAGGADV